MTLSLQRAPLVYQWLLGTAMAMAPLVVAVGYVYWSLDRHITQQQDWIYQIVHNSQRGVSLADASKELERSARQYLVLRSDRAKKLFDQRYLQLADHIQSLKQSQAAAVRPDLLADMEILLHAVIRDGINEPFSELQLGRLTAAFNDINQLASQYNAAVYLWVNQTLQETLSSYQTTKWHLLLLLLSMLPLSAILGGIMIRLHAQPIRHLSDAIRNIGRGAWQTPVAVDGPQDFVAVGQRLEWLRTQLLALDQHKLTFVQHVTHELKTPLAAIIDASELLMDEVPGSLTAAQRNVVTILRRHSGFLLEQIQQLLDLNGLNDNAQLALEPLDVQDTAHRIISVQQDKAAIREVRFELDLGITTITTDRARLTMMLKNLISNAVTHSPDGGCVTLRMTATADQVCVQVIDDGPGVDPALVDQLFVPFYQAPDHAQPSRSLHGNGLGLAIVKRCCDDLQGQIDVSQASGRGACFTLRLPKLPAEPRAGSHATTDPINQD